MVSFSILLLMDFIYLRGLKMSLMIVIKNKPKVCFSAFTVQQNYLGSFEQVLMPWPPPAEIQIYLVWGGSQAP